MRENIWIETMFYIAAGYLSGSILFAPVAARLFGKSEMIENSEDKNPGAFNAFHYGGFFCGLVTLAGDMLKGFLPVFLYLQDHFVGFWLPVAFVLAAPVLGHAFPIFHHFQGGKGIAVSFGCLLGLIPFWLPALTLAGVFLFFSLVLKITPNFYRTALTFPASLVLMIILMGWNNSVILGFLLITGIVCLRLHLSPEEREPMMVKLLWIS